MPVEAGDFLDLARKLPGLGGEIALRNAAGRAYYASYHACEQAARGTILIPADAGGQHASIVQAYEGSRVPEVRRIGYMLRQHRALRVKADYDIDEEFFQAEAEESLVLAERIFGLVASGLLPSS